MNKKEIEERLEHFLKYEFQQSKGESDRWVLCIPSSGEMSIYDECGCNIDEQSDECPCICHERVSLLTNFIYGLIKQNDE